MKRWLIPLAAICALLLAGEWFARSVLGLGDPPLSITHPRIEYLYAPNQDVRRFGKRFLVNDYSMRSAPLAARKGADERRVLVFGDSVVNGGNLTDHQDLATTRLAHLPYDVEEVAAPLCRREQSRGRQCVRRQLGARELVGLQPGLRFFRRGRSRAGGLEP